MNLVYEVGDVFIILLKKWYVILITVILFAGLSYPLATISYNNALKDYEELTTKSTSSEETNTENMVKAVSYFKITMNNEKDNELAITIAKNIVEFSRKSFVINSFKEAISKNTPTFDEESLSQLSITALDSLPIIMIESESINEQVYNSYINSFPKIIQETLTPVFDEKFTIEMKNNSMESINTEIKEVQKLAFNNMIFKMPTPLQSRIKIMVTASILGLLMSIVLVIILDFINTSKKVRLLLGE
jgi:hypothetical protein